MDDVSIRQIQSNIRSATERISANWQDEISTRYVDYVKSVDGQIDSFEKERMRNQEVFESIRRLCRQIDNESDDGVSIKTLGKRR